MDELELECEHVVQCSQCEKVTDAKVRHFVNEEIAEWICGTCAYRNSQHESDCRVPDPDYEHDNAGFY